MGKYQRMQIEILGAKRMKTETADESGFALRFRSYSMSYFDCLRL